MTKTADRVGMNREAFEQKVAGRQRYEDRRSLKISTAPRCVWVVIKGIGGQYGWYHAEWLWAIRGYLDQIFGGVGLRKRVALDVSDAELRQGDEIGFWRILSIIPGSYLQLIAEMKLPGEATLTFEISGIGDGTCEIRQIARFWPESLLGKLYWYSILPVHSYIFGGMIKKIGEIASEFNCNDCPEPCTGKEY